MSSVIDFISKSLTFALNMVCLLILSISLLASTCQAGKPWYHPEDAEKHFEEFIVTYNKTYNDQTEKNIRFLIFKKNLININTKNSLGHHSEYGITQFTDLTSEEFQRRFLGWKPQALGETFCKKASRLIEGDVPESVDWREKNKVTRVKNQGNCGSCWAFSVIGNVEGQYAIKHNKLVELSEQQLVDCDHGDLGCGGGDMGRALVWLSEYSGGSLSEADYPYKGVDGNCSSDPSKAVAKLTGCNHYDVSEDELKKVLAEVGPLSIGLDARPLMSYRKGVLTCPEDGMEENHGVLLVGYGKEGDKPYWLVKNSWSETFGEEGYVRLEMYKNSCKMLVNINSAVVA